MSCGAPDALGTGMILRFRIASEPARATRWLLDPIMFYVADLSRCCGGGYATKSKRNNE